MNDRPPSNESYFESFAPKEEVGRADASKPAKDEPPAISGDLVPPPTDPMAVARLLIAERYTGDNGALLLRHHRGLFYAWDGRCWPEAEERQLRAATYHRLEHASYESKDGPKPFEPNRNKTANVLEATEAIGHLDETVTPPAWLEGEHRYPATEVVAVANGLLHLPSRELLPHTPAFFSQHALPFDYDPDAPVPVRWLRFLDELWGDDRESIDALAEVMGYTLGGETSQQKIFMLVGPKRSGKGTIGRVLTGLLGVHNTAAPTLAALTTNFGLQPLVGKPLAVISDARLGTRVDGIVAVERLLSISGEDSITVDRKYRDPWTGKLPTRFLILTNELPRFTDSSGALASRFVLLTLNQSFYGQEDPTLTDTLLAEAPGIFNWALDGLARLTERGRFVQPDSAREALRHLEDMSSPVGAFVRDACEVGPAYEVDKDELFFAWRRWCEEEGREHAGTKAVFARDLRASVPGLQSARPGSRGQQRPRVFRGLRVRTTMPVSRDTYGHSLAPPADPPGPPTDTPGHDSVSTRVPGHRHRGAHSGGDDGLPRGEELARLLRTHRPDLIGNTHVTHQERREIAGLWRLYERTGVVAS